MESPIRQSFNSVVDGNLNGFLPLEVKHLKIFCDQDSSKDNDSIALQKSVIVSLSFLCGSNFLRTKCHLSMGRSSFRIIVLQAPYKQPRH
jgi:hypothetical protein